MKLKSLLLTLFITVNTFAQSDKEKQKIKDIYWGNDTQESNIDIPEKWNNESAVNLYQEYFYDYHKFAKNVRYTTAIRKRVKLLDKASVEEFSLFSFSKNFRVQRGYWTRKAKRFIGIRIIKPNGDIREEKVDKNTLVEENEELKLAISGLEVGDIIDYYVHTVESFKQKYGYSFKEETNILNDEYPTKEFVLKFNTENDFFINFQSYNDAPKLKQIPTEKKNDRRYKFVAKDIEKAYPQTWFYPKAELPFYKFQVTFARKSKYEDQIFNFLSDNEADIKDTVSKEDVLELYRRKYGKMKYDLDPLKKYFRKKELSKKELVLQAYYYLRHFYNTQYIQLAVLAESKITSEYISIDDKTYYIRTDDRFNLRYANFLIQNDIDFDLIVVMPRNNGEIKDLLYKNEVKALIRVNLDEPLYISRFNSTSNLGEISYLYEGGEAYALSYSYDTKKLSEATQITVPNSNPEKNNSIEELNVILKDNFSTILVDKKTAHIGHNKSANQEQTLFFFDYLDEDYKRFDNPSYIEDLRNKKWKAQVKKDYNALIDKYKERQKEIFTAYTNNEYDFDIEDVDYKIENTGRYLENDAYIYTQKFKVKDQLIKKAGSNYIFEIGKLIGDQISFTGDERKRINDIYMPYPRTYTNKITINIPEGYNIVGLDKLQKNVSNELASFKSSATINGNTLIVLTTKIYKENRFSKLEWESLLNVLDTALQFNNEKILFKK